MSLEELNFAFMFFRARARAECAEVAAFSCLWIGFAGIEPIAAGFEFANHDVAFRYSLCRKGGAGIIKSG